MYILYCNKENFSNWKKGFFNLENYHVLVCTENHFFLLSIGYHEISNLNQRCVYYSIEILFKNRTHLIKNHAFKMNIGYTVLLNITQLR